MTQLYDFKVEVEGVPDTVDSMIQQVEEAVQNELTYEVEIEHNPLEASKPVGRKYELIFTGQFNRGFYETDEQAHNRVVEAVHEVCPEAVVRTYWHHASNWVWDSEFTSESHAEVQKKLDEAAARLREELKGFLAEA